MRVRLRRARSISTGLLVAMLLSTSPCQSFAAAPTTVNYAPKMTRLQGTGYSGTAVALSKKGWATGSSKYAVLVRSRYPVYGAIAGPLAASRNAPTLSVGTTLPSATSAELKRLGVKIVYVLGSERVISESIVRKLRSKGIRVVRYGGMNVYHTARLVAAKVQSITGSSSVVIAPSKSPSRAFVASVEAAQMKSPLLLTAGEKLPYGTRLAIVKMKPKKSLLIGGANYIPASVTSELASLKVKPEVIRGSNAQTISVALSERARAAGRPAGRVIIAGTTRTGNAVGVSALAARLKARVLFTSAATPSSVVRRHLRVHSATTKQLYVCGPSSAVSSSVASTIRADATIRLSSRAEVLTSVERSSITTVTAGGIVFETVPSGLAVGDTIASAPTPEAPYGLLRKVTSLRSDGKTVSTGPASLDDVLCQGGFTVSSPIDFSQASAAAYLREGVAISAGEAPIAQAASTTLSLSLDDVVVHDGDGNEATTHDQVRINGSVSLAPRVDLSASYSGWQLQEFKFSTHATETSEITVSSAVSANVGKQVKIFEQPVGSINFLVGPVPVNVTPVVTVYVGADGKMSVGVSAGAAQSATFDAGVKYTDGKWAPISARTSSFSWNPPSLNAEASARVFAGIKVGMLIYGAAGPDASVESYVRVSATPLGDPLWELRGGMKASAGARLEMMSRVVADWRTSLFDWSKVLASQARPKAVMRGRVTAPNGGSLGGIWVRCTRWVKVPDGYVGYQEGTAWTDANGAWTIGDLVREGEYFVEFRDFGGVYLDEYYNNITWVPALTSGFSLPMKFWISPGQSMNGIDAQMGYSAYVTGVVTDSGGSPAPGVTVRSFGVDPTICASALQSVTDSSGRFLIRGYDPVAKWNLTFTNAAGEELRTPVMLPSLIAGKTTVMNVQLPGGASALLEGSRAGAERQRPVSSEEESATADRSVAGTAPRVTAPEAVLGVRFRRSSLSDQRTEIRTYSITDSLTTSVTTVEK